MTKYEDRIAARMAGKKGEDDPSWIPIHVDPREQRMHGRARHGNVPFDVPYVSQIEGNLWQGGCTQGLVLPKNIEHIVSLYPWEAYALTHEVKSALAVRMYDAEDQGFEMVDAIAKWTLACVKDGPTLVHCQAGLNRSSLIAARVLTLQGYSGPQAIELLRSARSPACLCNPAFESYIAGIPGIKGTGRSDIVAVVESDLPPEPSEVVVADIAENAIQQAKTRLKT